MNFGIAPGAAQMIQQPDARMSLARLMAPQAPAGGGAVFDPGKIMQFANMAKRDQAAPQTPTTPTGPDMSGNVMDPNKPFGRFANAIAGSDGLVGSNGWIARQFGAQPSAVNAYNGPPIGMDPAAAQMTPTGYTGG